jgi:hypothetical protein
VNDITLALLERLWSENAISTTQRYQRFAQMVGELRPAELAVVGRDLVVRKQRLFTPKFISLHFSRPKASLETTGFWILRIVSQFFLRIATSG